MTDDSFDSLLDRELGRYVDAPAPRTADSGGSGGSGGPGGSVDSGGDLIDRALHEVGQSPAAGGSSGMFRGVVAVVGASAFVAAVWMGLGPSNPPAAVPDMKSGTHETAVALAVLAEMVEVDVRAAPSWPVARQALDPVVEPSGPSAAELLRRAQQHRNDGKTSLALSTYRELLGAHPRSAEAAVSLISLGEIELVERARPARALRYFDRYLRAGGPLSEEARHGRVRALRKLGRGEDERAAIDALLAAHPDSVYADSVRKRRAKLEVEASP